MTRYVRLACTGSMLLLYSDSVQADRIIATAFLWCSERSRRSSRGGKTKELHQCVTAAQVQKLHAKKCEIAELFKHTDPPPTHSIVQRRILQCCECGSWNLESGSRIVVLSQSCDSQPQDAAHIRAQMFSLFDKDFGPLKVVATASGTDVNLLRCMVEGKSSEEFPAWQHTVQVAMCQGDKVVAAALLLVLSPALAWMPLLSVQPELRRKGLGRVLVQQINSLLAGFLVDSLLIPASNEPRLVVWWQDTTLAKKIKSSEVEVFMDVFPCIYDIDKTKMMIAPVCKAPKLNEVQGHEEAVIQERLDCRSEAAYEGVRPTDCILPWERAGGVSAKRSREGGDGLLDQDAGCGFVKRCAPLTGPCACVDCSCMHLKTS